MGANKNPHMGSRLGLSPDHHVPPQRGSKSLPLKFQSNGWNIHKMSRQHIWEHIGWLQSDASAMNNRTTFAKAPNEWTQIGAQYVRSLSGLITILSP